MSKDTAAFALHIASRLGLPRKMISVAGSTTEDLEVRKGEVAGKTVMYKGGMIKVFPVYDGAETKVKKVTDLKVYQFQPISKSHDFIRLDLALNTDAIPQYLVIDLDGNDIQQFKDVCSLIPESSKTLVTRTTSAAKIHIWFKYPQPTAEEFAAKEYIVQSRDIQNKCTLLGDGKVDIFTRGIVFEGYLTNYKLPQGTGSQKRTPPDYTKNLVQDVDAVTLSKDSMRIIKNSIKHREGLVVRTQRYDEHRNQMLCADIKSFTQGERDETVVLNIYNSIFNPREVDNSSNPFDESVKVVEEKVQDFYSPVLDKVVRKKPNSLPKTISTAKNMLFPLIDGNHEYYNNITLKTHSQVYLTLDEKIEFMIQWVEYTILKYYKVQGKTSLGYIKQYWEEFAGNDMLYIDPSLAEVVDIKDIGYFTANGAAIVNKHYVFVCISDSKNSSVKYSQYNLKEKRFSEDVEGNIVTLKRQDFEAKFRAMKLADAEREAGSVLDNKQTKVLNDEIKILLGKLNSMPEVLLEHKFMFGCYDTFMKPGSYINKNNNANDQPIINLLRSTPALANEAEDYDIEQIKHNVLYKQVHASIATDDILYYTSTDGSDTLVKDLHGNDLCSAHWYIIYLAFGLYNSDAPIGRMLFYSKEGGAGKSALSNDIIKLLFGHSMLVLKAVDLMSQTTPDYGAVRAVAIEETGYDGMTKAELAKFENSLKALTGRGETIRSRPLYKNVTSVIANMVVFEATNDLPKFSKEDRRTFPIKANILDAVKDAKLIDDLLTIKQLTQDSPQVLEFAKYLKFIYNTYNDKQRYPIINKCISYRVPVSGTKSLLTAGEHQYTEMFTKCVMSCNLDMLFDASGDSHESKLIYGILTSRPVFIIRKFRTEWRVVIHRDDMRLIWWMLLSPRNKTEVIVSDGYARTNGISINELNKQLDVKQWAIDTNQPIVKELDDLTGHEEYNELATRSNYRGISVTDDFIDELDNSLPYIKIVKDNNNEK